MNPYSYFWEDTLELRYLLLNILFYQKKII
jgi:hypothetical protein